MQADLSVLQAVLLVAQTGSFRQSARRLEISPSALSYQVAKLEHSLGIQIFHRTTRSVTLTAAGQRFVNEAEPALHQLQQAFATAGALQQVPTGLLRINASEGAVKLVFAALIPEFLARYPQMQLDIVTDGRLVDIVAEGFDLGIRSRDLVPQDMIAVSCYAPIRFIVAGAPDYFSSQGVPLSPADLHKHQCIRSRLPGGGPRYNWEFTRGTQHVKFEPTGQLSLDSQPLLIQAALAGIGLIWTNESGIRTYLQNGQLRTVLTDWSPAEAELCFYFPKARQQHAGLRAFLDLVHEKRNTMDKQN